MPFAAPPAAFGRAVRPGRRHRICAAFFALPLLLGAQSTDGHVEQRLLAAHNRERAALDLPPLRWSGRLTQDATRWADRLAAGNRLQHETGGGSGQGENLWAGTAGRYAPEAMVGAWSAEKAQFTPGVFPQVSRTGNWADVGHYTQMVWRDTREVGCAIGRGAAMDVLVCRYAAPGNVRGRSPF